MQGLQVAGEIKPPRRLLDWILVAAATGYLHRVCVDGARSGNVVSLDAGFALEPGDTGAPHFLRRYTLANHAISLSRRIE